jgi:hypothetical protein
MNKYQKRTTSRNYSQFDLFEWLREHDLYCSNPAVSKIAKRFGLSRHHAATIATLAGIGSDLAEEASNIAPHSCAAPSY